MLKVLNINYYQIQTVMKSLGYRFFDSGNYNLNLVGIRSASRKPGAFDDLFTVSYRVNGEPITKAFACTTDPGHE